jgi:adenosylcobinamide-GDP ribazoletransferase
MKEPTIGAIGAIYTFCFVLLKVAIITYILYEKEYFLFVMVCVFSRLNLIYLLEYFEFNKNSFLALAFQSVGVFQLKVLALIYVFIAFIFGTNALILFVLSLFSFYFLLKILNKKFGFVNGDCLGFTIEHTELVLLNIALMMVL